MNKVCTCYEGILCENVQCVYEFDGTFNEAPYWADWCPTSKAVHFGGAWDGVTPWDSQKYPPIKTEVIQYADDEIIDVIPLYTPKHRAWLETKIKILKGGLK